ncbi:MAG TPA: thioredoxin family protein [Abditibacteriaceae bacterium]|nr:thioredoxin family protein [Abditibacteriaceae bacterium]
MKWMRIVPFVMAGVAITALVSDDELSVAKTSPTSKSSTRIVWRTSFQAAQAEARRTGKPILVDFTADWCTNCKVMDAKTYTDANVIRESKKFVAVKVDTDKDTATAKKYRVSSLPVVAVLKPNGAMSSAFLGFRDAKGTASFLQTAYAKARRK